MIKLIATIAAGFLAVSAFAQTPEAAPVHKHTSTHKTATTAKSGHRAAASHRVTKGQHPKRHSRGAVKSADQHTSSQS